VHEGVGQVLTGVQCRPERLSGHQTDAGVAGAGFIEAQIKLVALVDLSGEGRGEAEVWVAGGGLSVVDVLEEVVLGDGWGLFGLLGAVGGGASQVQGGVQGPDLLDPFPHPPAFRYRVAKSSPPQAEVPMHE